MAKNLDGKTMLHLQDPPTGRPNLRSSQWQSSWSCWSCRRRGWCWPGRRRCRYQWSSPELSVISYQLLSVIRFQLSVISYQLSVIISYQLSVLTPSSLKLLNPSRPMVTENLLHLRCQHKYHIRDHKTIEPIKGGQHNQTTSWFHFINILVRRRPAWKNAISDGCSTVVL